MTTYSVTVSNAAQGRPVLITSARRAKSLDADERNRRYLLTMAVRVACFIGGVLSPSPWNWVLFVGAAVIPPSRWCSPTPSIAANPSWRRTRRRPIVRSWAWAP